jgi:ABC-type phosphate transport system auxiliary subunit
MLRAGNLVASSDVQDNMRDIRDVKQEIERLSERRTELWQELGAGGGSDVKTELAEIQARIASLWDEQREIRATLRFGDRNAILVRARTEERLERSAA